METLAAAFSKEAQSDKFEATLHTLERDSKAIHKVAMTYHNATTQAKDKMAKHCFQPLPYDENRKTTQPHAPNKQEATPPTKLTGSPMCGAHARQTGKPCQQPAMRGSKRCRLHGGKSTGRPINHGLRAKAFKQHIKRLKLLGALIAKH